MNNGTTIAMCSIECEKFINDLHLRDCSDRIYYIKPFDSFDFGDIKIDFVNCDHGAGAPDAVGVVIHVDGKTIYETGDTCLRLDRINEIPKDLDILIAPINGSFGNLDESECVQLAKALQPKMTIPCHYGMFASHHGDVGKFYEKMIENDLPFYIFQYGEGIVI